MAAMLTNPAAYPFAGSGEVNLPPEFAKLRAAPGLTRVEMPHGGAAWRGIPSPFTNFCSSEASLSSVSLNRARSVGLKTS